MSTTKRNNNNERLGQKETVSEPEKLIPSGGWVGAPTLTCHLFLSHSAGCGGSATHLVSRHGRKRITRAKPNKAPLVCERVHMKGERYSRCHTFKSHGKGKLFDKCKKSHPSKTQ